MSIQQTASVFSSTLADQLRKLAPHHIELLALSGEDARGKMAVDYVVPSVLVIDSPLRVASIVYVQYSTNSNKYNFRYLSEQALIPLSDISYNFYIDSYALTIAYQMCKNLNAAIKRLSMAKLEKLEGNDGMVVSLRLHDNGRRIMV